MNCCNEYGRCEEGPGCPVRFEKVMKMPLTQKNSDDTSPETQSNNPWAWIDGLGFWLACILTGAAIGIGWGLATLFQLF